MKKINIKYMFLGCFATLLFTISACKKDKLLTNTPITFSTDTLTFDTIFATLGSTTKSFTIINNEKKAVLLKSIQLKNTSGQYRINVDGKSGTSFTNIEIPAKDSIYVFVEVTINPNSANLPFLIYDAIEVNNGNSTQNIILEAYGQNAHFYNNDSVFTQTWNDDLPYVILNTCYIPAGNTLTINKGCNMYFGANGALIMDGNLIINGEKDSVVEMRGVRLDKDIAGRPYDKIPGQWTGIFFLRNSTGNINYLNLRNSTYGINVGNTRPENLLTISIADAPTLNIKNSKIYNNSFYGIFGFLGKINAENILAYDCGTNVVGLYNGGIYNFTHCTFYMRGNLYLSHTKEPLFYFSNYYNYSTTQPALKPDTAYTQFINTILYGSMSNEIVMDTLKNNTHQLYTFYENCIVKTDANITTLQYINCSKADPQFEDITKYDFHLKAGSPAINTGKTTAVLQDIDGRFRVGIPEIGVYEKP